MAAVLSETYRPPERIYVHQLNLTSADILRKQREKDMVTLEKTKVKEKREIKRRQKEEERKRDMQMLLNYNPWGKPGGGAPQDETKRTRFEDEKIPPPPHTIDMEDNLDLFNRKFGRPGAGAPMRTDSGKIITQIAGDPAIRFQDTQHVRLSIENQLRYKNGDRRNYSKNLEELIQLKQSLQEREKEREIQQFDEMKKLYPFGRQSDNGGSNKLSFSEPIFLSTKSKRRSVQKDDFDPWGKGFGNPARDGRGNVERHKFAPLSDGGFPDPSPPETAQGMTLNIGRVRGGGAGAPIITESGHPKTRLHYTLQTLKDQGSMITDMPPKEPSYEPWGKPGGGAPFKREGGKPFEEKMGWSLTGDPKKRSRHAKLEYMNTLQKEIEEKKKREEEEKNMDRDGGVELASVIRQGAGGRPKKDPITGELGRNPLPITDVTSQFLDIRRVGSQESLQYHNQLAKQAAERQQMRQQQKEVERAQSEQHVHTWESFWGRPGHGAPRDPENHRKENLNNLLQQPAGAGEPYKRHYVAESVPSKHKNRYEFPTKDGEVIKKDYEFRTPFPAIEA